MQTFATIPHFQKFAQNWDNFIKLGSLVVLFMEKGGVSGLMILFMVNGYSIFLQSVLIVVIQNIPRVIAAPDV